MLHHAEPLFVDPYAGCLIDPTVQMDLKKYSHHYCLATKFIDDKLLHTVNNIDGLKQILGVGAKIPRNCMFLHVPLESSNIQQNLQAKGFNGNQPSIWAIQGLSIMTLASLEEILFIVSSLAMNGCLFLGELPALLAETEIGRKSSTEKWIEKLFMTNCFRVDVISYDEVASSLGKELARGDYKNILFVAEQLRFSDDQMETWRREFQRIEEEGDEEGFEEL
ncbi:hypothetical protein GH714_023415 [Hevea brasiliensis]|uniref:Uncharacterized protein n=1 Tax=Hevea brasiliensis TaxID=3981 RepID=A0A6A6LD49_HEVBR|nr:hypothetical protein GH714_023415 [Hevea brasiliensis]